MASYMDYMPLSIVRTSMEQRLLYICYTLYTATTDSIYIATLDSAC